MWSAHIGKSKIRNSGHAARFFASLNQNEGLGDKTSSINGNDTRKHIKYDEIISLQISQQITRIVFMLTIQVVIISRSKSNRLYRTK